MAEDIKYILANSLDGNIRLEDFDIDWHFYAYRLRCTADYVKQRVIDRISMGSYYGEKIQSELLYQLKAQIVGLLKDFIWNQEDSYGVPYYDYVIQKFSPITHIVMNMDFCPKFDFEMKLTLPKNNICSCTACGITNEYAQPNQTDGTYVCYNCRR